MRFERILHLLLIAVLVASSAPALCADCNGNGVDDDVDVAGGSSEDCNENGTPDECEQGLVRLGQRGAVTPFPRLATILSSGDVDGDGYPDLIAGGARSNKPQIAVQLNRLGEEGADPGDFAESISSATGSKISAMDLGDVDNDGDLDVAAVTGSAAVILANDGAGTFAEVTSIPLSARAIDIALATVNDDSSPDLVVLHVGDARAQVSVAMNRGDGRFHPPTAHFRSSAATVHQVADMDGDGDMDIVTADTDPPGVSIFLNSGCGEEATDCSFSEAIVVPVAEEPRDMTATVFGDDAAADLVVVSKSTLFVLQNSGDGRSFEVSSFETETASLNVGDIDADGDVDIVSGTAKTVRVLLNAGGGVFNSATNVELSSTFEAIEVDDFDGDGSQDLMALLGTSRVTILWNGIDQSVDFDSTVVKLLGHSPHAGAIADFDLDGDLDVIAGSGTNPNMVFIENNLPADVTPRDFRIRVHCHALTSADFDKDGDTDLIVGSYLDARLSLYTNDGTGVFRQTRQIPVGRGPLFLHAADLNDDDWPDVVSSAEGPNGLAVSLNDGAGKLQPAKLFSGGNVGGDGGFGQLRALGVATGDFDSDGDTDLALANANERAVSIIFNNGVGDFSGQLDVDVQGTPESVIAGDWDGDGIADLATVNVREESVAVMVNRGTGDGGNGAPEFELPRHIPLGVRPRSISIGDFNSDGFVDIVTANAAAASLSILLNDGGHGFFLETNLQAGPESRHALVGDINADGALDIVTLNRDSLDSSFFFNQLVADAPDFLEQVCTLHDFANIAVRANDRLTVKYTLPARDDDSLIPTVIQNTRRHRLHHEFLGGVFSDRFPALTANALIGLTQVRDTRSYYIGAIERLRADGELIYVYSIVTGASRDEVLTLDEVRRVHQQLSEAIALRPLAYAPDLEGDNPLARAAAQSWTNELPVFLGTVDFDVEFIPYTNGVGYGRVRLLVGDAFDEANDSGRFTFQDIVVIDHAPRDIEGVVGGVLTAAPQGALSHVSVRTARRQTPNAFVDKAMLLLAPLEGKLVRLEVTDGEYTVEEATQAEAEAFWGAREGLPAPPPFDAEHRHLDTFEEMDFTGALQLETRYGGKATGLARLQTILTGPYEQYRERGFAIPLAHYVDFMTGNTIPSAVDERELSYQDYLEELFTLEQFATDSEFRFKALDDFRDFARENGAIAEGLVESIATRIEAVFGSREVMVRHRSSSNIEDSLEFNGAGLYESTSVCVADSFDDDDVGPSFCDLERDVERSIERALKKVWTSFWTFRAHEERAFYKIPQTSGAMGILVNRAFLTEAANGVAFTGDPASPRAGCFIVTAQVGEESVVSPEPGILPEVNILEVADGEVVRVVRSQRSTLVEEGDVVLADDKLRDLGALMAHIEANYPVDTGAYTRRDILLDMEFKLESDGSLAVKQIRPFLIPGGRPERPTFELVIPEGTEACGGMNLRAPSGSPRQEYESKSRVRFRPGAFELSADHCVTSAELFEEVLVGPDQELATANGPGFFRVSEQPELAGPGTRYVFTYEQLFSLSDGSALEIKLFGLEFTGLNGSPVNETLVLDEEYLTFELTMRGFVDTPPRTIYYASCGHSLLPVSESEFELADGTTVRIRERLQPVDAVTETGQASVEAADVSVGGSSRRVASYWDLVYSAARHNTAVTYWVILDPPLSIPDVDGDVHVLELDVPDLPETPQPQEAAAAYLDESFQVIARPGVLSFGVAAPRFLRGDPNVDGAVNIADAIRIVDTLFRGGEPFSCPKSADTNDDGRLTITDAVWTLLHLFGGSVLPEPTGACGTDPTADELGCESAQTCPQ